MPETTIKIQLLSKTPNAIELIYASCRQCYSTTFAGDIFNKNKDNNSETIKQFIQKIISSGHESPLEHASFSFAIQGVSRALTHQLVRHRLASFSQQSQRYVKEDNFDYIVPHVFKQNENLYKIFTTSMENIQKNYNDLITELNKLNIQGEKANQDARFVLPQATETKIVVTMNCRELKHFFAHRCCTRAQWEIRILANNMLKICKQELPEIFKNLGAKCETTKYCPEGENFSCGKYPIKNKSQQNHA